MACSSAYTSGSVTLPSRRSLPTGLPSIFSRAVKSSTSSTNWNAMPRFQAYSPSRSSVCESAPATSAPSLRANRKQAGGLAVHQFHAIGFGDVDAADALELQQLALHHHLGQPDQQVENVEIALPQRDLEGLHVEPVARQHAGVVAPLHVGRGPPAARCARRRSRRHAPAWRRGSSPPPRPDGWRSRRPPSARRSACEASSSSEGRSRLPPLDCRYWPICGDRIHRRHRSPG